MKGQLKTNRFSSHLDSKEGKKCKTLSSFWTHEIFPTSDRILKDAAECDMPVLHKSCSYFTGRRPEVKDSSETRGSFSETADSKY